LLPGFSYLTVSTRQTALKELTKCKEDALNSVRKILTFESDPLFTLNTEMLEEKRDTWRTCYLDSSYQYGQFGSKYDDELTVMSTVQAYFEVASKVSSVVPIHHLVLIFAALH